MVAVTKLARQAAALSSFHRQQGRVGAVTPHAIGLRTGVFESVVDNRDGREVERERLEWFPLKSVRVIEGNVGVNKVVTLEVPEWLAKQKGLV